MYQETVIQNSLISNLKLSDGAYRCYLMLQSMCYGEKSTCFPSIKYLSIALGRSTRTINRYIKELVKNDLISKRRRGSISNLYTVLAKKTQQVAQSITTTVKKAYNSFKQQSKGKNNKPSNWNIESRNYNFNKLESALLYGTTNNYEELLE
jgi:DNA-binding transcriptional MocR family regulator